MNTKQQVILNYLLDTMCDIQQYTINQDLMTIEPPTGVGAEHVCLQFWCKECHERLNRGGMQPWSSANFGQGT